MHSTHRDANVREFVIHLNRLWKQIPTTYKRAIGQSKKKAVRRKSLARSKVTIPETLNKNLVQWKDNIRSFFTDEQTLNFDLRHPIAESYKLRLQLKQRDERDVWRGRFLEVAFHHLLAKVCGQYKRSEDVSRAAAIIKNSGIVNEDTKLIGRHVVAWADTGRRMELLCKELDRSSGVHDTTNDRKHLRLLFLLPGYISQD